MTRKSTKPGRRPKGRQVEPAKPQRGWWRLGLNGALLLFIVFAVYDLQARASRDAAADRNLSLPSPVIQKLENGLTVARLDWDAMCQWTAARGLPDPPPVGLCIPEAAEALLAALRKLDPEPTATSLGHLGRIAASLQRYRCAARYFELAVARAPKTFDWIYHLGCVRQELGQSRSAVSALRRSITLDDGYPLAHARLAHLLLELNDPDGADAHARRYVTMVPEDNLGYVMLARVALARDDEQTAIGLLKTAIEKVPDDFQGHYYLGRALARLGRNDEATHHLGIAAGLSHGNWFTIRDPMQRKVENSWGAMKALVKELDKLKGTGDWAGQAALAEQILRYRPDDVTMMGNLAAFYRKLERFDDAHRVLNRAVRLAPGRADLHTRRAALFLRTREFDQALAATDEAVGLDGSDAQAWNIRGRALWLLGRRQESEAALRRSISIQGNIAERVLFLAQVLEMNGKPQEAVPFYRRVLKLNPNHPKAREALSRLQTD